MLFVRFMAGSVGRGARVVLGIALIVWGIDLGTTGGFVLAFFGLAPLLTEISNVCPIGPIFKAPFSGRTLTRR